jgi:SPP1 family predicted phage head-tail adaptor
MRAGALRDFVTIEQPVNTPDGAGQIRGWQEFAKVWIKIQPYIGRRGDELVSMQQLTSNTTMHCLTRYIPGVTHFMRIKTGEGRIFNIQTVIDMDNRHRDLELWCVESL